VTALKADSPTATLKSAVVLERKALNPKAVLLAPVVFKARVPTSTPS